MGFVTRWVQVWILALPLLGVLPSIQKVFIECLLYARRCAKLGHCFLTLSSCCVLFVSLPVNQNSQDLLGRVIMRMSKRVWKDPQMLHPCAPSPHSPNSRFRNVKLHGGLSLNSKQPCLYSGSVTRNTGLEPPYDKNSVFATKHICVFDSFCLSNTQVL